MASQEAHDWWADVQDQREALGDGRRRRSVAVWADDDFDLVPAGVIGRRPVSDELAPRRTSGSSREIASGTEDRDPGVPVRGHRFVRAPQEPRRVELVREEPAAPARRQRPQVDDVMAPRASGVVQIKGRPEERRSVAAPRSEARRAPLTARERVEHQPDRIMLWVTALGFLLILLAFATA